MACDAEGCFDTGARVTDVFVVDTVDGTRATVIARDLRLAGYSADRAYEGRSMKSQMKAADRSNAAIAVIIGESEAEAGQCTVRNLSTSEQATIPVAELHSYVRSVVGPREPRRHPL
jgi:histidyl-tRNA synthetase